MIYNEEFETLPREVLEALQLKRLKQVVKPGLPYGRASTGGPSTRPESPRRHHKPSTI